MFVVRGYMWLRERPTFSRNPPIDRLLDTISLLPGILTTLMDDIHEGLTPGNRLLQQF